MRHKLRRNTSCPSVFAAFVVCSCSSCPFRVLTFYEFMLFCLVVLLALRIALLFVVDLVIVGLGFFSRLLLFAFWSCFLGSDSLLGCLGGPFFRLLVGLCHNFQAAMRTMLISLFVIDNNYSWISVRTSPCEKHQPTARHRHSSRCLSTHSLLAFVFGLSAILAGLLIC